MDSKSVYLSRPWLKFYEAGVPANPDIPLKSVAQAVDEATTKFGAKTALVFNGRETSFRGLREHTDRLAVALAGPGLRGAHTRTTSNLPTRMSESMSAPLLAAD